MNETRGCSSCSSVLDWTGRNTSASRLMARAYAVQLARNQQAARESESSISTFGCCGLGMYSSAPSPADEASSSSFSGSATWTPELSAAAKRRHEEAQRRYNLLVSIPAHLCDGSGTEGECAICLANFTAGEKLKTLPCLHHFHASCLREWFRENTQCPVCRTEVDAAGSGGGSGSTARSGVSVDKIAARLKSELAKLSDPTYFFHLWDRDENGVVDREEFYNALLSLNIVERGAKSLSDELFERWDADASGGIDIGEFSAAVADL